MLFTRLCFWFLVCCAIIYAAQLVFAAAISAITNPPLCTIVFTRASPAPICDGFGWSLNILHLMSLPGTIVTYPLEIAPSAANPIILMNPVFLTVMLIHVCAWAYGLTLITKYLQER